MTLKATIQEHGKGGAGACLWLHTGHVACTQAALHKGWEARSVLLSSHTRHRILGPTPFESFFRRIEKKLVCEKS